jgi:predicted membrane protein
MPSFTIWLIVSLIAVYIHANSDDEMSYLCATISVVSIIASLVLAPWQIKLLLLVLVLMGQQLPWLKKSTVQSQTKQLVNLSDSESNPKVAKDDTKVKHRDLVETASRPTFELKYRGVSIK